MAERRYSFRFSLPEGCVILLSLLLTSFLVFLFGVYVGKEVEAHKAVQQIRTAKLPASMSGESAPARLPTTPPPVTGSSLPAEKVEAPSASSTLPVSPVPPNPSPSSNAAVTVTPKKAPPVLPNSVASIPAVPKPQSELASASTGASTVVPPRSASPSTTTAAVATMSKSRPSSSPTSTTAVTVPAKPASPTSTASAAVPPKPKPSPTNAPAVSPSSVLPAGAEFDAREKKPASSKRWAVQIQATTQETAAQNVAKQLREQGLSPVISRVERQGEVWYRVRIGKFTNAEEAESLVSRFRREGKFTQAYPVLE